ncbi:Ger(x)C family spore germination C-terminal domain-containing protein [Cohnella luojiensis]|uniref:Spore germination GerAC-like C-terminal domain-containing protein n=1 Tax=Cohnella luojiensis TaxID=652876 RepID=A0A4Y8LXR3_9BACL|nr:Ger(x)C family spore germination C-terminal domain-containing protein [Cohnella luojiensis]TFE26944.1 hypothetical protein E2980_10625 [Cohnella luojiensis]
MFKIIGAYAMHEHLMKAWFSEDDLKGLRWFNKKTKRALVKIPDNKKPTGTLVLIKPHHRIQMLIEPDEARFNIYIEARAVVEEMTENVSIKAMEEQAERVVRAEILSTYRK